MGLPEAVLNLGGSPKPARQRRSGSQTGRRGSGRSSQPTQAGGKSSGGAVTRASGEATQGGVPAPTQPAPPSMAPQPAPVLNTGGSVRPIELPRQAESQVPSTAVRGKKLSGGVLMQPALTLSTVPVGNRRLSGGALTQPATTPLITVQLVQSSGAVGGVTGVRRSGGGTAAQKVPPPAPPLLGASRPKSSVLLSAAPPRTPGPGTAAQLLSDVPTVPSAQRKHAAAHSDSMMGPTTAATASTRQGAPPPATHLMRTPKAVPPSATAVAAAGATPAPTPQALLPPPQARPLDSPLAAPQAPATTEPHAPVTMAHAPSAAAPPSDAAARTLTPSRVPPVSPASALLPALPPAVRPQEILAPFASPAHPMAAPVTCPPPPKKHTPSNNLSPGPAPGNMPGLTPGPTSDHAPGPALGHTPGPMAEDMQSGAGLDGGLLELESLLPAPALDSASYMERLEVVSYGGWESGRAFVWGWAETCIGTEQKERGLNCDGRFNIGWGAIFQLTLQFLRLVHVCARTHPLRWVIHMYALTTQLPHLGVRLAGTLHSFLPASTSSTASRLQRLQCCLCTLAVCVM